MQWAKKQNGFTIVELLIVIVVIAILAAITIVAYNGISDRAKKSALQSAVSQAAKKVMTQAVMNADNYPDTLSDASVADTSTIKYQYTKDNTVSPKQYCVTATSAGLSYYSTNTSTELKEGICPGHNWAVWDKSQPTANPPVTGPTVDTSTFRTSVASMRLPTNTVNQFLKGGPFTGAQGQVYTISFWIKTDANWNGTASGSKVRFSRPADNGYYSECTYNGVKTNWTFVTCSRTVLTSAPSFNISLGNDGTVGSIWIDDLSLTRSE